MGDSLITIIAIFLAAILMFVFPLMSVDNISTIGKITVEDYDAFMQSLAATGNSYDVEMEVKVLDENPGKKTTWAVQDKIGENIYYSVYTSQIEDVLYSNDKYILKEGDIVTVSVKNTNTTISQMLRNFFYTVSGKDTYQIAAKHAAMVKSNGN